MRCPLPQPVPAAVIDTLTDTDWDEYAIVDHVEFLPATTTMFEDDHLRTEVYRYRSQAPPPSTYDNGERRVRLYRVTRPLLDRLGE